MQSFAFKAKSEMCRTQLSRQCCARAEAYGVLLYCNTFTPSEVRIITENPEFAGRRVINTLGYDPQQIMALHVNFGLLEEDCCRTAFLRGAFLAGGSVTDPEKRYHLELATSHKQASREVSTLLEEMGFLPRSVQRGADSLIYFKQSEHIEDLLTKIGAPAAAMDIMTAKVDKEIRNGANRAMNCDMANVNKTLDAAQEQVAAIEKLRGSPRWKRLPEKLQQTAALRLEYPELSLSELAAEFDPPVSKSCMNHRMRKLMEEANDVHE